DPVPVAADAPGCRGVTSRHGPPGGRARGRVAAAILGSRARPSRMTALAITGSFRATATGAALDGLPVSRCANSRSGPGAGENAPPLAPARRRGHAGEH